MSGGWGSAWAGRVAVQRVAVLDPATSTPDRRAMAPTSELRPAVDALLAEFLRHLALERGRSAHTVRAYRADLTPLLASLDDIAALDLAALRRWLAAGHAAQGEPVHARAAGRRRPHLHRLGPSHRAPGRPTRACGSSRPDRAARCRPCSARSRPPPCSTPRAPGPKRASRWRCATSRCSSCSTPPVCGWPSCAGSTSTTSTPQSALAARARQGRPGAHGRLRRSRRGGARPLAHGRPSALVKPGSPPALLLGARGKRLDPRVARSVVHRRRAPCPACRTSRRTVSDTPPPRT